MTPTANNTHTVTVYLLFSSNKDRPWHTD